MKKCLIIGLFIFIISLFNISYAKPITISEDIFTKKLSENLDDYSVHSPTDKEDNRIKVFDPDNNHICTIEYNLNTLTFYIDVVFKNSDNILDFLVKDQAFNVISSEIYATLCDISGVPYWDSYNHISKNINVFDFNVNEPNTTITYKDKNIPTSDFKDYSVYIAKDYYSTKRVNSDKSSLNTYELIRKVKSSTKTSCSVTGTLKINRDYLTYSSYLNKPENITKSNADHVVEVYVGKTFSISLGKYKNYDVSNYNCIASKANGNTINVTGNHAGIAKLVLISDKNWNIETYYISVKNLPKACDVIIIPPTKIKYQVGEKLDLTGLSITAIYDNNEIKQVTKDYTVKGYNKNKEGKQTITINYEGFSKSYQVQVGKKSSINTDNNNSNNTNIPETNIEKLPQTGNYSYIKSVLSLITGLLYITLIYLVYKCFKYNKIKK